MKPKTQRHADATGDGSARERILKTAEQIFAEMGFEGTSLRQIAVHADVPVALVSYHFKNKLGLYREVFKARIPIPARSAWPASRSPRWRMIPIAAWK